MKYIESKAEFCFTFYIINYLLKNKIVASVHPINVV